jgi:N12 class adenine-specific DNA methylase
MKMKGLQTQTSDRSIALKFLTDYVKRVNGGHGVHTFTGTPLTNTLTEIYNQMRFVMDDQMERDGVKDWDSWFNTFAEPETNTELTATGEYEPVTRLSAFVNVAELSRMAGQYLDVVFADECRSSSRAPPRATRFFPMISPRASAPNSRTVVARSPSGAPTRR